MADLNTVFAGRIHSPNPFWLASGPPTNCGEQIMRAFDAGWGGAVWKTLGEPIVNVTSRYSSVDWNGLRMMGLNNIELITDRPLDVNLREIAEVKKRFPRHAVIASLMVESKRESWHQIVRQAEANGSPRWSTALQPLADIANVEHSIPRDWISEDGFLPNEKFLAYAQPLIEGEVKFPIEGGLPKYVELDKAPVEKKVGTLMALAN